MEENPRHASPRVISVYVVRRLGDVEAPTFQTERRGPADRNPNSFAGEPVPLQTAANYEFLPRLRNITISTTLACSQACPHCWVSAGEARSDELSADEIMDVLIQARELGAEHVKLTGGEPFSRFYMPEVISFAVTSGYRVSVETNGMTLPSRLLKSADTLRQGLTFLVSLDGPNAAVHDPLRGIDGAFKRVIASLACLRNHSINFGVQTVVSRSNVAHVPALHQLVCEIGAVQHKLILGIHNLGRGSTIRREELELDEVFQLLEQLPAAEFWDYTWNPHRRGSTVLMTTLPPAFQPLGTSLMTCGWGSSFLSILADGEAALCHGLYDEPGAALGNVRTMTLAEIWGQSERLNEIRKLDTGVLEGICRNCVHIQSCRGLCRANAFARYRDLGAPYPFCQSAYEANCFPSERMIDPTADASYSPANAPTLTNSIVLRTRDHSE